MFDQQCLAFGQGPSTNPIGNAKWIWESKLILITYKDPAAAMSFCKWKISWSLYKNQASTPVNSLIRSTVYPRVNACNLSKNTKYSQYQMRNKSSSWGYIKLRDFVYDTCTQYMVCNIGRRQVVKSFYGLKSRRDHLPQSCSELICPLFSGLHVGATYRDCGTQTAQKSRCSTAAGQRRFWPCFILFQECRVIY